MVGSEVLNGEPYQEVRTEPEFQAAGETSGLECPDSLGGGIQFDEHASPDCSFGSEWGPPEYPGCYQNDRGTAEANEDHAGREGPGRGRSRERTEDEIRWPGRQSEVAIPEIEKLKSIKTISYNARTLYEESKRDELSSYLSETEVDLVMISESKLHQTVPEGAVNFPGFQIASRLDRASKHPGGGLLILVRDGINFHNVIEKNVNFSCQVASVQIKDTYFVLVYRRPQTTKDQNTELVEHLIDKYADKKVIFFGDYNLPGIDFDEPINHGAEDDDDKTVRELWKDFAHELQLVQHVRGATQKYGNTLDLVMSREIEGTVLKDPIVDKYLFQGMSDHYPILTEVALDIHIERVVKYIFDDKRMDIEKFVKYIEDSDMLNRVRAELSANDKWIVIRSILLEARKHACPVIKCKDRSKPPWTNQAIEALHAKIGRLRRKIKSPSQSVNVKERRISDLKVLSQRLKKMISEARLRFESKNIDQMHADKNLLFKHVKKVKRAGNAAPPINGMGGQTLISNAAKASEFQRKFMGIYGKKSTKNHKWNFDCKLGDIQFHPAKIRAKVMKMKRNVACGIDTIGPSLYKDSPFVVFESLSHLFRRCFDYGEIPLDWTVARVKPLWKNSGSKSDINKYRPVSIGVTACKIMEAMSLDPITELAEAADVFGEEQHGFRKGRSTMTNLNEYWRYVTSLVDRGRHVHVLGLDMSSAFDKVDIDYLLDSLEAIGIGGRLGRFIELWLKNRYQMVEVGDEKSGLEHVGSGFQQGSLSGPAFFNIAASRLMGGLKEKGVRFLQYADDVKLIFEAENEAEVAVIQDAVDELVAKAAEAGLSFNGAKSTLMTFGARADYALPVALKVGGEIVPQTKQAKDLGVLFQSNMSFSAALTSNLRKAYAIIHIVRATFKVRSLRMLRQVYESYFLPIITYGCEVWASEMQMVKEAMIKGYKAFWRLGGNKFQLPADLMDPFQICVARNLGFLRRIQLGKTCHKFDDFFQFVQNESTRTFTKMNMQVQESRKNCRYNFFGVICSRWYNQLNPDQRNSSSEAVFKAEVKRMIKADFPTKPCDLRPLFMRWRSRQN